jgi:hypothetical protein
MPSSDCHDAIVQTGAILAEKEADIVQVWLLASSGV